MLFDGKAIEDENAITFFCCIACLCNIALGSNVPTSFVCIIREFVKYKLWSLEAWKSLNRGIALMVKVYFFYFLHSLADQIMSLDNPLTCLWEEPAIVSVFPIDKNVLTFSWCLQMLEDLTIPTVSG